MDDDIWYDHYEESSDPYLEDEEIYKYDDLPWEDEDQEDDDDELYVYEPPSLSDVIENCVVPTLGDVFNPITKLFLICFLQRLITRLGFFPVSVVNLLSILGGVYLTYDVFNEQMVYLNLFCVLVYVALFLGRKSGQVSNGVLVVMVTVAFLVVCELFVVDEKKWHTIRGSQMLLAMKVISVGYDLDNKQILQMPSLFYYFGYCLSPTTAIFGPWISYNTYLKLLQKSPASFWWIPKLLVTVLVALFFLTLSTCWTHWLIDEDNFQWIVAYRDAMSYRSSHYFVSFISEAAITISGLPLDQHVAEPQFIELPRSLVEVVTHWNIPIHYWLKTYVFKVVRPYGNFWAVIATYAASSLLHGLNFQLAAVLLSLGFYTYIEHMLRLKLSKVFDACIQAKQCKRDCVHRHKHFHFGVRITNFAFGCLAVFHLAYLGVMFASSTNIEETGYDMMHTLSKWSELNFASHWVALATYIFHILL